MKYTLNSARRLLAEPNVWLTFLLLLFVILMLPGTYPASRTAAELATFNWDEPLFMLPPLNNLLLGNSPGFFGYGNFPAFFTAALFLPLLLFVSGATLADSPMHLAVMWRLAQITIASLGLYFLYRLGRRWCSAGASLGVVFLVMTTTTFCSWTLTIHPDIFQTATFVAAVYFLVDFFEAPGWRSLVYSAVIAGFAAGSKYWGVFILPAAFAAIAACYRVSAKTRLRWAVAYPGLVLFSFFLFNSHYVTDTARIIGIAQTYAATHPVYSVDAFQWATLASKIALLTSPGYYGSLLFFVYLGVLITEGVQRVRGNNGFRLHSMDLIHISFLTMTLYLVPFFNDPNNLPKGERYLLPFMVLIPIPVAAFLEKYLRSKRLRKYTGFLAGLLLVSQLLRLAGVSASRVRLGQQDLQGTKEVQSLAATLGHFYFKERHGSFLVDQWIRKNVNRTDTLYIETYMNVDLGIPVKRIDVDLGIRPRRLATLRPDYIFTQNPLLATLLVEREPYTRAAELGTEPDANVYVLKRKRKI